MTMHTISTYFHGRGGGGVEGEREEAGAARLGWAGTGGKRKWERHSESFSWCMGGGGGDEKVGMALLGWDSLLQGGIQS